MKKVLVLCLLLLASYSGLAKNCNNGILCGNSCIPAGKVCHVTSSYNGHSYLIKTSNYNMLDQALYYKIHQNQVNVYASENTASEIKFVLNKGTQIQIIAINQLWYKVSSGEGIGFIAQDNLVY